MGKYRRPRLETTWQALEDFTRAENALVVVDGSGSMYEGGRPLPIAVAISLGLYYAQRNKGAFGGHFITFSENPQLVEVKGKDIAAQVQHAASYCEVANTDLQRVFRLILRTAVKHGVPQAEMPQRLYIVSDMEFDDCIEGGDETNFARAKALFEAAGYRLPRVVFWNVNARHTQFPVTQNEQGVVLASGCSPRVFAAVTGGEDMTPLRYMTEVLSAERYAPITA